MIHKLWRRAQVQERTVTREQGVKTADGWSTIDTVYCSLEPLSARELRMADQNGEVVDHEVWMRYRNDLGDGNTELLPRYQLIIDARRFEIRSAENVDFNNEWTRLRVEERA